jgi:hypothetical protein
MHWLKMDDMGDTNSWVDKVTEQELVDRCSIPPETCRSFRSMSRGWQRLIPYELGGRTVRLFTQLHLMPRLWICGDVPPPRYVKHEFVCLTGVALTVIVFCIKERRWKRSISISDTHNSQRRSLRFVKLTSGLFYPFVVLDIKWTLLWELLATTFLFKPNYMG